MKLQQDHSWTQPEGLPNLIGRKQCDWTFFIEGTTIPQAYHTFFTQANLGVIPEIRPSRQKITLIFEGRSYSAELYREPGGRLSIEHKDRVLKALLRLRLFTSYSYLTKARLEDKERAHKNIIVPHPFSEHADYYRTLQPFVYLLVPVPCLVVTDRKSGR